MAARSRAGGTPGWTRRPGSLPGAPLPAQVGHELAVLREHCDEVGRDYGAVRKILTTPGEDVLQDWFLERMRADAALGIDQVWIRAQLPDPAGATRRIAEQVLPRLAELQPA